MRIKREDLLNDLEMVRPGLSAKEFIEQSSCLVFKDGMVMTFNDEISCRKKIDFGITGAVQAEKFISILEKIDDPFLRFRQNEKGELEIRGKSKITELVMDAEIFLPVESVEEPKGWQPLSKNFSEVVEQVRHCAGDDETRFLFTCVHIHPEYVEACDNHQLMRYRTDTGLRQPILVRGSSIGHVTTLGMDKVALTSSWAHFKNPAGLIFSCRRYAEDYPDLSDFVEMKSGKKIAIPKGLAEASERCEVLAQDKAGENLISIALAEGKVRITGEGVGGRHREIKKVNYRGPAMKFSMSPKILRYICAKYSSAELTQRKFKASGENWEYVTVLNTGK